MTAQLDDTVLYRDKKYDLAAFNGEGLFDPTAHGLTPARRMSTCWRGYLCEYEIVKERLTLQRLGVILFDEGIEAARRSNGPLVFGKTPNCDVRQSWIVYSDLGARLDYTGGLLLASGFIDELFVNMGFQSVWKYREVLELGFDAGRLFHAGDRSLIMEALREAEKGMALRPGLNATRDEVERWVEDCFSRNYEW